jgi:hypothetical protein
VAIICQSDLLSKRSLPESFTREYRGNRENLIRRLKEGKNTVFFYLNGEEVLENKLEVGDPDKNIYILLINLRIRIILLECAPEQWYFSNPNDIHSEEGFGI